MKPTELVGTARVPGGRGAEMRCFRHDGHYRIFADRTELMSTRVVGSEQALAELAVERRGAAPAEAVLVGGLGMGFTLARLLELVGSDATVDVVELVPEIVDWNREFFGALAGHPLADPRVRLTVGDVGAMIRAAEARWDTVLLDVDNGPAGLSRRANAELYGYRALRFVREALRPGGVLAVWSAADEREFPRRLEHSGFRVEEHRVRARRTKGPLRTIWLATAR